MRWFKFVMTVVVLAIVYLFIQQNIGSFNQSLEFKLDLPFLGEDQTLTWSHSVYGLIFISALVGFVLGFFSLLLPYFRSRRQIKELKKRERQVSLRKRETITPKKEEKAEKTEEKKAEGKKPKAQEPPKASKVSEPASTDQASEEKPAEPSSDEKTDQEDPSKESSS